MKRKPTKVLAAVLCMVMLTAICAGAAFASTAPAGRRTVTFWHCFGGNIGEAVQAIVDQYNESQDQIWVDAIFQGSYDECLTKIKAAAPVGTGPDMFQMFELGTTFLASSGYIIPFQDMLEKDSYVELENIEPALRRYYTYDVDGQPKLLCIPFNPSTPIMYYNKTAFEQAGLDPENPPTTFAEIIAIAEKLTVKEGNRTTRYAMGLPIYGWFFENFLAGMGATYVNNNNGRTGIATAVDFDATGAATKIVTTWKQMVDDGLLYDYGVDNAASRAGFIAGQTAITMESTAQLTSLLNAIGDSFELGACYLPSMLDKSENAVIIGGANLWLADKGSEQSAADAWEFIKFATSAEMSAQFSMQTGYFCANTTAYDQPSFKEYLIENPIFLTAINQLHDCPDNYATNGASVGVMPELRAIFQEQMALYLQDVQTLEDTLKNITDADNAAIETYNKTVYGI
ncbi:ABC transporter substrate-binding protein [Clostridia bacterium]|nr:ABC transporter substrate-binding protein [Clostridia bacterium]